MIYLDNAATTLQKPASVARSMKKAVSELTSPGRGGHKTAMAAAKTAYECREKAAALFNLQQPENIVFTMNATHALNIAIKSIAQPGSKVVVSGYEHNSVIRPLYAIGADVSVASSELFEPEMAISAFEKLINKSTELVICTHVSNVFGYILPIERIAKLCNARKIPFIIDASQSAGVMDIDFSELQADFIAMPGHKSLYGPQGTGILLCKNRGQSILQGGTGTNSLSPDMPKFLPDELEAGTHNMPGIAGLSAGLDFIAHRGTKQILSHEKELLQIMSDGLKSIGGIKVYVSDHLAFQSGVLSFALSNKSAELVAEQLAKHDIAVRAGLHCSPTAHRSAGTLPEGTIRASLSAFNTKHEINNFLNVTEDICKSYKK